MTENIHHVIFAIVLLPLLGSLVAGFFGKQIGRTWSHRVTISYMLIAFVLSLYVANLLLFDGVKPYSGNVYTWASGGKYFDFSFHVGFLVDQLTAIMLVTVSFVSLLVHIYSIGYMVDDDGYQRFFSYISLFTFAMLMLVSSNNFLQLFFGWEGVGLVSYLLIGFWFKKESAIEGSLKAFLVNRVGDFGFILGIGLILAYTGSMDYHQVFSQSAQLASKTISLFPGTSWSVNTVICILLFIGAMGKSAQIPLHVWLPESMEGPTPISALIHAATMVTAGVFMVARMSPLFELSVPALSMIMIIGATGALFTGLIAIVMNDIKRVVAYSTLSQLGYMMVANGASAFSGSIFHLMTHACFKALLFLGAGSVIIGMHHEQDMRKMGGLWKYMPITYVTFLIGSLALCGIPPFAGFYSKDIIIEAAKLSTVPGATYAFYCVTAGVFVTAVYTFRAFFMTFHGKPRMSDETLSHVHESPWVVTLPLVLLAIPSIGLGAYLIAPMLFHTPTILGNSVTVLAQYNVIEKIGTEFHGAFDMATHAVDTLPFWLASAGILTAFVFYILYPSLPALVAKRFPIIYNILINKYGFDTFNERFFVKGGLGIGDVLYTVSDQKFIDGLIVNGSAKSVKWFSSKARLLQSGYLYHYATVMVLGLLIFLVWLILG